MSAPLDALWDALWEDLRHNATGRPTGVEIIARHRPGIEAAVREPLRRTLEILGPAAERGLAPDGTHNTLPDGYCPDCGGGCLLGFVQPVPLVEPSPFVAKGGPR